MSRRHGLLYKVVMRAAREADRKAKENARENLRRAKAVARENIRQAKAIEKEGAQLAKAREKADRYALNGSEHIRKSIPDDVQIFVWQRDGGRCVKCGSQENLEYDHIIPFSKGGSSTARNLQLLCGPCNRAKSATIGG